MNGFPPPPGSAPAPQQKPYKFSMAGALNNHVKAPSNADGALSGTGVVTPTGDFGSGAPPQKMFAMFASQKKKDSGENPMVKGFTHVVKPDGASLQPHHPPTAQLGHNTQGPLATQEHLEPSSSSIPSISSNTPASHSNHNPPVASAGNCPDTDSPLVKIRHRPAVPDTSNLQHIPSTSSIPQTAAGAWISRNPRENTHAAPSPPQDDIITLDSPEPLPRQQARPTTQDPPKRQRMIVDEGEDSDDELFLVPPQKEQAAPLPAVVRKRIACLASPTSPEQQQQRQHHHPSHPAHEQQAASNIAAESPTAAPTTHRQAAFMECSAAPENLKHPSSRSYASSGSAPAASPSHAHVEPSKRLKRNDGGAQVVVPDSINSCEIPPLQIQLQQQSTANGGLQPHQRLNLGVAQSAAPLRLGRLAQSALSLVPMRSITQPVGDNV